MRNVYVLSKHDWSSVWSVQVRNVKSLSSGVQVFVNLARALFEEVVHVDNVDDIL